MFGIIPLSMLHKSHIPSEAADEGHDDLLTCDRSSEPTTRAPMPQTPSILLQRLDGIVKWFLQGCDYQPPRTPRDPVLRAKLALECNTWSVDVESQMLDKMIEASCSYAETAFGHTSPEHRYFIALYTACMFYAEEFGDHDPQSVAQFARRLIKGQQQLNPILDRLADLLKDAHLYWTDVGADAIITGTIDALSATLIEFATVHMDVVPSASRYPYYLRTRAGGGPQYTHFMFMRSWRENADTYLQVLPEIEHWTLGTKLSFYKEELAGENSNYVHLRAAAEEIAPVEVLHRLTEEVLDTARRIDRIVCRDEELAELWEGYRQRYLEFCIRTPRYRLSDFEIFAESFVQPEA